MTDETLKAAEVAALEAENRGLREALKECLDWMQWGTHPHDKTPDWQAMHARGCQALTPSAPSSGGENDLRALIGGHDGNRGFANMSRT